MEEPLRRAQRVCQGGPAAPLQNRVWTLPADRLTFMGIVNCTPDSFSDGLPDGTVERFIARARRLMEDGADVLDIGGESTRPFAGEVSLDEELRRVLPVIAAIRRESSIPISIDTRKARVAAGAIEAGATIVNDVSACRFDAKMIDVLKAFDVPVILMHSRGTPETMQLAPHIDYDDVLHAVRTELECCMRPLIEAGIDPARICLDPGFGFAKTAAQSLELLERIEELKDLPYPMLIGLSRKRFLEGLGGGADPADRDAATALALARVRAKGFSFFRVHDVAFCRRALQGDSGA